MGDVKFEAGMVVRFSTLAPTAGDPLVVDGADRERVWCREAGNPKANYSLLIKNYAPYVDILSPAPRAGDTWTDGERVVTLHAEGDQLRMVSGGEPFVGSVVDVARRLWEGGYRRARQVSEAHRLAFEATLKNDPYAQAIVDYFAKRPASVFEETVRQCNKDMERAILGTTLKRPARPAYVTLDDMKDRLSASEPQPALAGGSSRASAALRFSVSGAFPRSSAKCGDFTVQVPALKPGTHVIEMNPSERTALLRSEDGTVVPLHLLPRAGEAYQNAAQTILLSASENGDLCTEILSSSVPMAQREIARYPPDMMAEYLRERGYRRVEAPALSAEERATRSRDMVLGQTLTTDPLRSGDVFVDGNGTEVQAICRNGRWVTEVLRSRTAYPVLINANDADMFAEMLREHGYKCVIGSARTAEQPALSDAEARSLGPTFADLAWHGALGAGAAEQAARRAADMIKYADFVAGCFGIGRAAAGEALRAVIESRPCSADVVFAAVSGGAEWVMLALQEQLIKQERERAERAKFEAPQAMRGEPLRRFAEYNGIVPLPNESDDMLRARLRDVMAQGPSTSLAIANIARVADKWRARRLLGDTSSIKVRQRRIDAVTPHSALDGISVARTTGDDLRKLAELNGVPEVRAGMVVRDDSRGACGEFGLIADVGPRVADVRWVGGGAAGAYRIDDIHERIASGRWRIVDHDIRPLAALADAVAAIFARPDRVTARRYVDQAIATLRGEPFAAAMAAALRGWCERSDPAPFEVAAMLATLRAYELARGEVAPGARELTESQRHAVLSRANVTCFPELVDTYERARART